MPKRIHVIADCVSQPHRITSPELSDEDAASQLEEIGKHMSTQEDLRLPWLAIAGRRIDAAHVEDQPEFKARGGTIDPESMRIKQL